MIKNSISIIIPVHNTNINKFIKCLDSLNDQTDKKDLQIIVVNDRSTDNVLVNFINRLPNEKRYDLNFIIINNKKEEMAGGA